ncbi:uncharacterized protein LOC115764192 [Drosophila novamexicana]|uniref:uncharacterized protein LOC115764192 n=1 Tax=Drosophila novamexicana TaxID=47314 RepID=UPI0011E5F271|nr:uncharacterized protein LOC115764192 [Drosophila novamexicana]
MAQMEALLLLLISLLQLETIAGSDLRQDSLEELQHFKQCVRGSKRAQLSECLGRSALNFIQRFEERENVSFAADFVAVKRETAASRSLVNVLDTDPVDFRGILENAGAVMGQRSLEWHMDAIYPGLMFKIGPTADANSVAEFVLDTGHDERQFGFEDASTGRLLAKQYLVPFLLGLKFNLVALVPLLFAGICLLLKKSLFLAKLAIYVSSFLGLGGVLGTLGGGLGGGFGGGLGGGPNFGYAGGFGAARPIAHFPGKTTVFGHGDELHHQYNVHEPQPYKRSDRKVRFEQPRETAAAAAASTKPTPEDRFYEYEKQRRPGNPLEDSIGSADALVRNLQSSSNSHMNGWQAWQCLGAQAERLLDAACQDNSSWQLSEYLSIEPQQQSQPQQELQTGRAEAPGLAGKLLQLAAGRALRVRLPRQLTISNAIDEFGNELGLDQGRKKKDKDKNMAMMGGMIMLATFAQMFLGKVILIAGGAFIMAKIALAISLLGSLKKGSSGHSGSPEHVIVASGGHSHESGWHRSMPTHDYSGVHLETIKEESHPGHEQAYYAYEMEHPSRRHLAVNKEPEPNRRPGFL